MRVFGVDFRSPPAGEAISNGLATAAAALGVDYTHADVLDPALVQKVEQCAPELLLVVHGRLMAQRHRGVLNRWRSAVWLLDEPYEVDDTARWSGRYTFVFANDTTTLDRHQHASSCPLCFDPKLHYPSPVPPVFRVGFIGLTHPTREQYLVALGDRLDLLVGDFQRSIYSTLRRRAVKRVVRPAEAADLYRQTAIVVNIFRDVHHYNRENRPALALNPRIYEATACGALVLSDPRPKLATACPSLPTFSTPDELVALVDRYLADDAARRTQAAQCRAALAHATFATRLQTMLATVAAATRACEAGAA